MVPEIFGWEHIVFDAAFLVVSAAVLLFVRKLKKENKNTDTVVRVLAGILLACILWNRISVSVLSDGWGGFLPGTFCGASSLALSLIALFGKRNNAALHCVAYVGLIGGILTLGYPDFIGQNESFLYACTISGMMHHAVMMLLVVTMLYVGFLKPDIRKYHYLLLGLCVYMTYGVFCISVLGYGDAMYIYNPILDGTALNWLVLGVIFLAVFFVFLLLWGVISKKIAARRTDTSAS